MQYRTRNRLPSSCPGGAVVNLERRQLMTVTYSVQLIDLAANQVPAQLTQDIADGANWWNTQISGKDHHSTIYIVGTKQKFVEETARVLGNASPDTNWGYTNVPGNTVFLNYEAFGHVYGNPNINFTGDGIRGVVAHEIGHNLGLNHNSERVNVVHPDGTTTSHQNVMSGFHDELYLVESDKQTLRNNGWTVN